MVVGSGQRSVGCWFLDRGWLFVLGHRVVVGYTAVVDWFLVRDGCWFWNKGWLLVLGQRWLLVLDRGG